MSRRTNSAVSRLRQDYLRLKRDPVPYIVAEPLPSNLQEWHYVVTGPEGSPYAGGFYHGRLVFPAEFPFKPPSIYMSTPSGRFKTETRLCLSISDYHPDTWNPAWSVATILTGLLSFMLERSPTLGSIETSDYEKRSFAARSHEFNLANKTFCELFPEQADKSREVVAARQQKIAAAAASGGGRAGSRAASSAAAAAALAADDPLGEHRRRLERNQAGGRGGGLHSALTNVLVIGGFAAFAFVVQYVLQSIAAAD